MKIIILLLLLLPSYAYGGEWSTADKVAQSVVISALVIDWGQTKDIKHHDGHDETNEILGKHPSDNVIDIYFVSSIVLHTVVANYLPDITKKLGFSDETADWSRKVWQYTWIGIEGYYINSNYKFGYKVNF